MLYLDEWMDGFETKDFKFIIINQLVCLDKFT